MNKRDKKKFKKMVSFLNKKEHDFYRDYLANKNWNPMRIMMFLEKLESAPDTKRDIYLNEIQNR